MKILLKLMILKTKVKRGQGGKTASKQRQRVAFYISTIKSIYVPLDTNFDKVNVTFVLILYFVQKTL